MNSKPTLAGLPSKKRQDPEIADRGSALRRRLHYGRLPALQPKPTEATAHRARRQSHGLSPAIDAGAGSGGRARANLPLLSAHPGCPGAAARAARRGERFIAGKAREIAELPAEPAQSSRPRFLHAFPSLTPLGCDLVIEEREACVRQPQQREAQKAGDLDRAMRILDRRQRCRFPRHHPSREMLQTGERQIRQDQPVGAQFLEEADLLDLLGKAFGCPARRHGTKPFAPADAAVLDRRQKAWHPNLPAGRQGRSQHAVRPAVMPPIYFAASAEFARQSMTIYAAPCFALAPQVAIAPRPRLSLQETPRSQQRRERRSPQ
jgi:hypothetical protein